MKRFAIIADDLTGANDSGVQLSKKGLSTTVFFNLEKVILDFSSDVIIIDTDSRAIDAQKAFDKVSKVCKILRNGDYRNIYKKVDSTLRGNIASEVHAVISVYKPDLVIIAPAYPKMNRTTINGHQHVNGIPVEETEFGRDPKTPVIKSFIPAFFSEEQAEQMVVLNHQLLKQNDDILHGNIIMKLQEGLSWFVCDAETDEDLAKIAEVFVKINKKTLWVGSAGLIEFLPKALGVTETLNSQGKVPIINKTLTISGSLSIVTKRQLEKVRGMSNSHMIEMDLADLLRKTYNVHDISSDILESNPNQNHLVLYVDSTNENRVAAKAIGNELGLSDSEISETISHELGIIAKSILNTFSNIDGLILTGGDTAKAVCTQLNIHQMILHSEVEPGLPLGILKASEKSYWAITKAGGFGNDYSLVNTLKFLIGEADEHATI